MWRLHRQARLVRRREFSTFPEVESGLLFCLSYYLSRQEGSGLAPGVIQGKQRLPEVRETALPPPTPHHPRILGLSEAVRRGLGAVRHIQASNMPDKNKRPELPDFPERR